MDQTYDELTFEETGTMLARDAVKEAEELIKPKSKKLREKLQLREATEALEENEKTKTKAKAKAKAKTKTKANPQNLVEYDIVEEEEF